MLRKHIKLVVLIRTHVLTRITRTKDELMLIRDTGTTLIMLLVQHHHRAQEQRIRFTSIKDIG